MSVRILLLCFCLTTTVYADDNEVYSKKFSASEVSSWFFGPGKTKEEKMKMALNVGRVNIGVHSKLNCGKISMEANIHAEFRKLNRQLTGIRDQVKDLIMKPESLAVAVICYMQKNVCSHIRHFSALLQREVDLQFNACKAIDEYIDDEANKGQKRRYAEAFKTCVGNDVTPERIRQCKNSPAKSRNLLKPFDDELTNKSQNVLHSILRVVQKDENYNVWSKLLGEVRLSSDGYYKPLFPNDMLKAEDFAHNVELESRNTVCNAAALKAIIQSDDINDENIYNQHLRKVIKEKLTTAIADDLVSLPEIERNRACSSLGDSLAALALKRLAAEGRSDLAAALANDALTTDLKDFYQQRANQTFKAFETRVEAGEIKPVAKVLAMIQKLSKEYRQINREEAAGITARRAINNQNKDECNDQLSCERL